MLPQFQRNSSWKKYNSLWSTAMALNDEALLLLSDACSCMTFVRSRFLRDLNTAVQLEHSSCTIPLRTSRSWWLWKTTENSTSGCPWSPVSCRPNVTQKVPRTAESAWGNLRECLEYKEMLWLLRLLIKHVMNQRREHNYEENWLLTADTFCMINAWTALPIFQFTAGNISGGIKMMRKGI